MIQANELRIGNWVTCDNEPCQVQEIECTKTSKRTLIGLTVPMFDNFINTELPERVEPIPLTPEILEKCGFDATSKGFYYRPEFPVWIKLTGVNWLVKTKSHEPLTSVKSLHQIQNLYFALTGTELDYKP